MKGKDSYSKWPRKVEGLAKNSSISAWKLAFVSLKEDEMGDANFKLIKIIYIHLERV